MGSSYWTYLQLTNLIQALKWTLEQMENLESKTSE
jgi:hypothetical protein